MLHVVHHVDYMAPPPERGTFKFDKYYLVMEALRASGALGFVKNLSRAAMALASARKTELARQHQGAPFH